LVEQVKADTATALQEHMATLETAVINHVTAMQTAYDDLTTATKKVNGFDKKIQAALTSKIGAYNASIKNLFKVSGNEAKLFYIGLLGAVATPIILALRFVAQIIGAI